VSRLIEARGRLISALETNGVRTAKGGQLAAPCVLIEPGDPWTEPHRMPGRNTRWRLTAIGGKADADASYVALGDLIDGCDIALRTLDGVQLPTWTRPLDYALGGVAYAATVSTIQMPVL
jgi:hypothetical protein